ncbi:acyl carrier protein [Streptomyces sp. MS1.HAVA.3]|uniref:Acyl carrier protein n=1 Tax=Streptomyces caledonius TaxID=3134107 RepID=A0ABU8U272_9ACTN
MWRRSRPRRACGSSTPPWAATRPCCCRSGWTTRPWRASATGFRRSCAAWSGHPSGAPPGRSPRGDREAPRPAGRHAGPPPGVGRARPRTDHAAALLGHDGTDAVEPDRAFNEVGFDSLTAVGLRNKLTLVTGMKLPASMIFDYPNPRVLAGFLVSELAPAGAPEAAAAHAPDTGTGGGTSGAERFTDDRIRELMASIDPDALRGSGLLDRLLTLTGPAAVPAAGTPAEGADGAGTADVDALDTEALINMAIAGAGSDDATRDWDGEL